MNRRILDFIICSFCLGLYFLGASFLFQKDSALHSDRAPANQELSCRDLLTGILRQTYERESREFFTRRRSFDQELFSSELAEDLEVLKGRRPMTLESLMAIIQKMSGHNDLDEPLSRRELSRLRRLGRDLYSGSTLRFRDVEEGLSGLLEARLGRTRGWMPTLSQERKELLLQRLAEETLVRDGLRQWLSTYPQASAWSRFKNSMVGKTLATGLFNLPVLTGFPPLYFPGLKKLILPRDLAEELLEKGFSDELWPRLHEALELGRLNLEQRYLYERFKNYYMAGAGLYFTIFLAYDSYEDAQAREEERMLLQTLSQGMTEMMLPVLNSDGRAPSCRSLEACFLERQIDPEQDRGEAGYQLCKSLFDRRQQCEQYP